MEAVYEKVIVTKNGISYPFKGFIQEIIGSQSVVDAHYHEYIEILYCKKGSFHVVLNGISKTIEAGDMLIINSMEVHISSSVSPAINEYIVLQFTPELLYTTTQTIFEAKYVLPFTMKTSTHQKLFKREELKDTFIPDALMEIISEDTNREYGFEIAIRTNIGQIFLWILRKWHKKGLDLNLESGLNQINIKRLESIFDYVDDHYNEQISIAEMAQYCNISYSYFSRFFKKMMSTNFSEYVNHIRISKAEFILATSDKSITDIAMAVGFTTTSYFIQQFKLFKNITPKQYRKLFKATF